MSTLLNRLKTEYREKLELERALYPSTVEPLIDKLNKTHFIVDLRFGDVLTLQRHTAKNVDPFELLYY